MTKKEERARRLASIAQVKSFIDEEAKQIQRNYEVSKGRKIARAMAQEALFFGEFQTILDTHLKELPTKPVKYVQKPQKPVERILNVMLSDLHFGARLDGYETPIRYGPNEEARRLAWVVHEVCSYKLDHRKETILYVHLLGDIIQGKLHDPQDGAAHAEQVGAAVGLLQQAIAYWAKNFREVVVRCTPGNHGRNTARHQERATHQKWDSHETTIYQTLATWSRAAFKNVRFEIPKSPYYVYKAFNQCGFMTHGDTVVRFGFPGKSIDSAKVEAQVNAFIVSELLKNPSLDRHTFSLVGGGHVHIGSCTYLPNGAAFMTNGALVPPDGFALSQGHLACTCGQWMWESVPNHIIGDQRFITVGVDQDADASLEKIVKPQSWENRKDLGIE